SYLGLAPDAMVTTCPKPWYDQGPGPTVVDRRPAPRGFVVADFDPAPVVITKTGRYVCPNRNGVYAGMPAPPPPDKDPGCHRETKVESRAAAEGKRLLATPEADLIRGFAACDGRLITQDVVE